MPGSDGTMETLHLGRPKSRLRCRYRTEELEKLKESKQKLNTKKRRKDNQFNVLAP